MRCEERKQNEQYPGFARAHAPYYCLGPPDKAVRYPFEHQKAMNKNRRLVGG